MTKSAARDRDPKSEISEIEAVELPRFEELSYRVQRRLEIIQRLESHESTDAYRVEAERAASELNLSIRSLKRLLRQYREKGIEGLKRQVRSDDGQRKVSEDWQQYIVNAYRKGNRGMQQTSRAQIALQVESRAAELGEREYPSRRTVYRILEAEIAKQAIQKNKRSIGWVGEELKVRTREGTEIEIDHSNQVWQCDHTPADIAVVDERGEPLGRPTLTLVIDSYSRCIVGLYLGMERPSATVTSMALRQAMLPKTFNRSYEPECQWESYGKPKYLYTDAGSDFTSSHIERITSHLGIVLCQRRRPSEGGIIERAFKTISEELLSGLPGYTTSIMKPHRAKIEAEACLTLEQVEGLLVRYVVDNYNQRPDARGGRESRSERWKAGLMAEEMPPQERELDLLLMQQEERRVYRGGYVRFANLVYRGEYLGGYEGEKVVLRYDPRDITSLYIYRQQSNREEFLTRAHALNLETERLSLTEAKAIARRLRRERQEISNKSVLAEIRERQKFVEEVLWSKASEANDDGDEAEPGSDRDAAPVQPPRERPPLPQIQVYDYEQLRRGHGS